MPIWLTFRSNASHAVSFNCTSYAGRVSAQEIVAERESSASDHFAKPGPVLPIVLGKSIFHAQDRILIEPFAMVLIIPELSRISESSLVLLSLHKNA